MRYLNVVRTDGVGAWRTFCSSPIFTISPAKPRSKKTSTMATNPSPQWPPIFLSLANFIGSHAKSASSPSPPGSSAAADGLPSGARPSRRQPLTLPARCGGYKSTACAAADDLRHHPRPCAPPNRQTFSADTRRCPPNSSFAAASVLGRVPTVDRSRSADTFVWQVLLAQPLPPLRNS